ncbi:MAG: branched-chain amino acid transport system substrate-binding protein [Solirubrobacteraceae bacterium]|jgi:ABC-type branched-subunit amino acid transport system substrate-binding protein|nr:branched-chain amino acid transport system substrate-binding protein [Solirubrobacteraceae bacterium]
MSRAVAVAAALALAVLAGGCGHNDSVIIHGGQVPGQTLTVYSLLPRTGPDAAAARDAVLGEKLALEQAHGVVGRLTINYVALDLPATGGTDALANTVRDAVSDPSIAAVIGDLSSDTARVTAPLLNAVGILHVSPGATSDALTSAPRYVPSGRRTFVPLLAGDGSQAAALARAAGGRPGGVAVEATAGTPERALAAEVRRRLGRTVDTAHAGTVIVLARDPQDAFGVVDSVLRENRRANVILPQALWASNLPDRLKTRPRVSFLTSTGPATPALDMAFQRTFGTAPGPYGQVGYDAMRTVLAAIRRAGARAATRDQLIKAYLADPAAGAARRPWRLARRAGGGTLYEPVRR